MSDQVFWVIELKIKEGEYEAFEGFVKEIVEATRASEPGTLSYEWFVDVEKKTCHIFERYADSDAVFAHLSNFNAKFGKRYMALLKQTRWVVYGSPSESLKRAIGRFGAEFMDPVGGYTA